MRIRMACECGKRFNLDEKYLGKFVQCPGCKKKLRVEASPAAAATAATAVTAGAPALASTGGDTVNMSSPDLVPPSTADAVPGDKSKTSPLAKHAPLIIFGSIGAFLLLCLLLAVGIIIGISSFGSRPADALAENKKTGEKKSPSPGKKEEPVPPQPIPATGSSLRFVPDESTSGKRSIEIAVVDTARIPYKVRRLKLAENIDRKRRLQLGLTLPMYDDMGRLLDALGDGYRYKIIREPQLVSIKKLREFDVIFLTCKPTDKTPLPALNENEEPKEPPLDMKNPRVQQTLKQMQLEAKIQGIPFDMNKALDDLKTLDIEKKSVSTMNTAPASAAIRRFVEEGGTLYASDMRYEQVLSAFPEMRPDPAALPDWLKYYDAAFGHFDGVVVDPGLRQYLGQDKIDLKLETIGWKPALFDATKATTLMRGQFKKGQKLPPAAVNGPFAKVAQKKNPNEEIVYPLLTKFQFGKGTVIFTSFHNEAQHSDVEKKFLEYLVFSLVTSGSETKLKDVMLAAHFALADLQLLTFSKAKGSVTKTYAHKGGSFQVAVGFETIGTARFRLQLTSPQGHTIMHEESGLYLVEVPAAAAGNWECTVTSVSIPYDNFPVMLGIGKGK